MTARELTLCALLALASIHCDAGTIVGTIRAHGVELKEDAGGGAYASRKFKFAEKVNYDEFKDFVVSIDGQLGPTPMVSTGHAAIVTQEDAIFDPHVLPVAVGTTVEWPNEDDIFHNVFSFSDAKEFDLGLYRDERRDAPAVTFDKPGRIDVFCSIHKNMHCIILVLENPYFARADDDGRFAITNVPAGTYRLKAWHERMPPQYGDITVPEDGTIETNIVMGITGLPRY